MGKNSKPILSVLVDEDRKDKFSELARRYKYSMGWLLNDCIDRMLESDSIDIYRGSVSVEDIHRPSTDGSISIGISAESIDEMIRSAIASLNVPSREEFDTIDSRITSALTPLRDEISEVAGSHRNLEGEILELKKSLTIV